MDVIRPGMPEQRGLPEQSRRRFVNWLLGSSAAALVASVVYPIVRYLIPPPTAESATGTVTLALRPDEIPRNSGQIFRFGSRPGILIRTASGELRAFSGACTHLGCIVQYRPDLAQIWCACHNGHFDTDGRNVSGPPPSPLEGFSVHVRDDQIVVSRRV
jgi:Rieske Fe-S protein